jgi:hypothetical protein
MSDNPEENVPNPVTPTPKKIAIDIPKEVTAVYANLAFISHTPAEMVLDFAQILPRMPRGTIKSRIIMSPMHAKLLHKALGQNIANYERQFGEIRMPSTIADQFFRFPQQGPDNDQKD